ncbi:MAG TPA: hypothetical protein VG939_00375 [Caulobacteraceae bacterium]|nr:hypothetical protein [Caulobacteraceae bacterium]
MRAIHAVLAASLLAVGCSKPAPPPARPVAAAAAPTSASGPAAQPAAAPASGPAVSGTYLGSGKDAGLTQVTAHAGEPFDGKPVTVLVFSAKDQTGSQKPDFDAIFGKFGNAMVLHVRPDGSIVEADLIHEGLEGADRSVSVGGVLTLKDYKNAGGQISGVVTSGGVHDVFGKPLDVNLSFHTAAP